MPHFPAYFAFCVIAVCGGVGALVDIPGVKPSEHFDQSMILDNDKSYILFWKFNDTHVTFEVHVKTFGYVGFGISSNGRMYPADIVIGWISNGTTHFSDRHATDHVIPVKDTHQDWHLLYSEENDFGTVLKFVRKIDTCDATEDTIIQPGTVRLIFSHNAQDPVSDDNIPYHGATRGTKSVSLLNGNFAPNNLPSDITYYDFLNQNYVMPTTKTTYHCTGFHMPDIGGPHHMIAFEAVLSPGNEKNLHHMLLYRCHGIAASAAGVSGHCYNHRPHNLPQCSNVVVGWAVGGEPMYFPNNVGLSVNGIGDPSFYILETHYDNPTLRSDVIDNSGVRITLTTALRPIEAGMLFLGFNVDMYQIVPPHQKAFVTESHCTSHCIAEGLKDANETEIRIFGVLQHAHLLGVGITTRHFRNGAEIKPIMTDKNYDFDYQEFRPIKDEVLGDSIHVDCTYDSSRKAGVTFGGLSTHEEMCLSFAYYYPKIPMSKCVSNPIFDTYTHSDKHHLYNMFSSMDWSDAAVVSDFEARLKNSTVKHRCKGDNFNNFYEYFVEPEIQHPYVPPATVCT